MFNARTAALVLSGRGRCEPRVYGPYNREASRARDGERAFVFAVTPLLSAALAPALPQSRRRGLLADFDGTVKDLATHKRELHAKTVGIMRDRLAHHSSRLPTIWCSRVFTERSRKAGSSGAGSSGYSEDESKGERVRRTPRREARRSSRRRWARRSGRSDASSPGRCALETRPRCWTRSSRIRRVRHGDAARRDVRWRRSGWPRWGMIAVRGADPGTVRVPRVVPRVVPRGVPRGRRRGDCVKGAAERRGGAR